MQTNRNNIHILSIQQTILAALLLILAFVGGLWFLAHRVYTTTPTTEVIMITLPPEMVASNAVLTVAPVGNSYAPTASAVTVEIEREKPERKWFSALLHPFGFMVLLLVIIAFGSYLLVLVSYYGQGGRDG